MLLRNVKIWDGVSEEISSDYDAILIENGRVKRLTSADEKIAGVASRDYQGAFVVPGLIDAHIHLCLDPAVQDPFAHGKVPVEAQLQHMADRAGQLVPPGSRVPGRISLEPRTWRSVSQRILGTRSVTRCWLRGHAAAAGRSPHLQKPLER